MTDLLPFELKKTQSSIIKVIGVGGGGGNAVNYMYEKGIANVDFLVSNTDEQVLLKSPVPIKIHLGRTLTEGLGAGNQPERGKEAAIESIDDIKAALGNNTKMVFITAGMGGGTGTGAAPVIAEAAQELGILTIGIVTIPFEFEGNLRINQAIEGVEKISEHVDSLIVINNERLREIYGDFKISEAFSKADDVLTIAVKGIAEIITKEGYVNVDFADVNTVMRNSGVAVMGRAESEGEGRALKVIEEALNSPLLSSNDITGSKNILINMTHGEEELTTDEVSEINSYAQNTAGKNANLIWGLNKDESLGSKIHVTIIATGFKTDIIPELYVNRKTNAKSKQFTVEKPKNTVPNNQVFVSGTKVDLTTGEYTDLNNTVQDKVEPEDSVEKEVELSKDTVVKNEKVITKDKNLASALQRMKILDKDLQDKGLKKQKTIDYSDMKKNIEKYENQPAYDRLRANNLSNDTSTINDKPISKYSLDEDDDDIDLKPNSFLHDNVD